MYSMVTIVTKILSYTRNLLREKSYILHHYNSVM